MLGLLSKPQAAADLFAQEAQLSASTSTEADTAAATVAATAGAPTAATMAGGDQPMDAETVDGSKQIVNCVRSDSQAAQHNVLESAEGRKSAVESKVALSGAVQGDLAEAVMPGYQAAAPQSLVAMETELAQLAPLLKQAEMQANDLKPELKHDLRKEDVREGQLGATDVPSTLLYGPTAEGHLASAAPVVPSALGNVPFGTGVGASMLRAGPSSSGAGSSSLAARPSSLGAGPSSLAAAPTEHSQSAVTASICKAHMYGRQLAGATHTVTEQHANERQAEPLAAADLPIEKAAAHGKRVSDRGKEGKSKGGQQEQSLVAKPQLTGRAALELAVLEAGGNNSSSSSSSSSSWSFTTTLSSSSVAPKLTICVHVAVHCAQQFAY